MDMSLIEQRVKFILGCSGSRTSATVNICQAFSVWVYVEPNMLGFHGNFGVSYMH